MKIPGLIRTILFFCLLYAGSNKLKKLQQHTVNGTVPVICYDQGYLNTEQRELVAHFLNVLHEQHVSIEQCIMRLQQQFPYVAAGSGRFIPGLFVEYHVTIRHPICRVNGNYVLTDDGMICTKECYDEMFITQLPEISVEPPAFQHEFAMRMIAAAMLKIDSALVHTYHVTWHAPQQAILTEPNNTSLQIVCDVVHVPTQTLLDTCNQIYMQVMGEVTHQKGSLVADIRFANQVVVYRNMRGR